MSAKVDVLRPGQDLTSRATRQVKKTIALHLVEHALAYWIVKNKIIQLIAAREFVSQVQTAAIPVRISLYDRSGDSGFLLPPLPFYQPFVDLPLWLLEIYWRGITL